MNPLKCLWQWSKAYHVAFFMSVLCSILAVIAQMIPYFCIVEIVNKMFLQVREFAVYRNYIIIALISFIMKVVLSNLSARLSHHAAYHTLADLRNKVLKKMVMLPMGSVLSKSSGYYKQLVVDRIEAMEVPFAHVLPEMTSNILVPTSIIVYLFILDWRMALLSLSTLVIGMVIMSIGMKDYATEGQGALEASQKMTSAIVEYIDGIEVVKAFSRSAGSYAKYKDAVNDNANYFIDWMKRSQKTMCTYNAVLPSLLLGVLPGGMALWICNKLDLITFLAAIVFAVGLIEPIMNCFSFASSIAMLGKNTEEINAILIAKELKHTKEEVTIENHEIKFDHVSFGYQADQEILHDVSFTLKPNSVTAIVGPSGSGKSTIAKLLAGYWEVTDGKITLDQHGYQDIPMKQLMSQISYISQHIYLFENSILENIRMGNQQATEKEVIAVSKACGCHEFIEKLEHGYHTNVGSKGLQLSGGERQRIAIARAMLKDAPIVIMDEATSFIDPENEAAIQASLSALTKHKTVFMIAHRLSTIVDADCIIVLRDGHVEAMDTHQNLLQTCSLYKDMYRAHMEVKDA